MKKIHLLAFLFYSCSAFGLNPADFTIQRVSAPYFVVDGNNPATGPTTAYVGFEVKNTGAVTYTNLKFTITSVTTSVVGQNYTLVSPASGIVLVGTLAPGDTKVCYFYVQYPANVTPQATFNYSLSDATASGKTGSFVVSNRSSISANAGGLATQTMNNQDLIGGIITDSITYTLGNIRSGDEADFQVSVSTQFDPTKLVLLKTQVTASTVSGVPVGTTDSLYFTCTANNSSGSVSIKWTFRIASYNFTSLILPYAGATSGSTNYKYAISTDLGGGTPATISSTANPLTITKTSDKALYLPSATAIFTVTINNPGAYGVTIDKITDQLPAGFVYQSLHASSQVTSANSTTIPASGATGTVTFEGGVASGVNTSYYIPASGSLILKYTATAPATPALNLLSTAKDFIGVTQVGSANVTVGVSITLPVNITNFKAISLNGNVKLDWTTETENNSSYFTIERSTDNTHFTAIGQVGAAGNSSDRKNYSFTDSMAQPGVNYYRLKMVDINQSYKYSTTISVQNRTADVAISSISPNPFVHQINIELLINKDQNIHVKLVNNNGTEVVGKDQQCNKGRNNIIIDRLNRLTAGTYVLQIMTSDQLLTEKIIKVF